MILWLTPQQAQWLTTAARDESPREACGILGGAAGRIIELSAIRNIASAPDRAYRMDDAELARTLTTLSRRGLEPVAFYHSHPAGDPRPSALDISEWAYPDVAMIIIGLRPSPALTAWSVRWGEVTPIELVIETAPEQAARPSWTTAAQVAVLISVIAAVALLLVVAFSLLPPPPPIPSTPLPR